MLCGVPGRVTKQTEFEDLFELESVRSVGTVIGEADSERVPLTSTNFGADQVVLVRDDDAKRQLQKDYGNIGLTLTILQSKGMEFSDVKLVNFFSTCTDPSGLRRLPALLNGKAGAFDA
ncbi:MAG: hypothetical protein LQ346_005481, partial [Caloplaca aetnensis]